MKINTLTIEGIGGIEDLKLELNENMNIICGPNGIGKTTILEVNTPKWQMEHQVGT